ncbi:MAG: hypothetical protein HYZ29_08770 [Myxococcales bacterium]|nr:hypothetical protein [Myxococcales bacterium]
MKVSRPPQLALAALILASLLACKKSPHEAVEAECTKRFKGQPDLAQRVTLAQNCLQTYRRETFGRDRNYNPLVRGKDDSAANETLHFSTVLNEIESACGAPQAKSEETAGCTKLCNDVADARLVYPHFVVDADQTKYAATTDLRGLCARDFGVSIPRPAAVSQSGVPVVE